MKDTITKKNLLIVNMINGGLTLLFVLLLLIGVNQLRNLSSFNQITAIGHMIVGALWIYKLNVILLVIGFIGWLVKMANEKVNQKEDLILFALIGIACICFFIIWPFLSQIQGQLTNPSLLGLGSLLSNSRSSLQRYGVLLALGSICSIGMGGYSVYLYKNNSYEENVDGKNKDMFSLKEMMATPEGKKKVQRGLICGIVAIALVIGLSVYSANKKTNVDLTADCEPEFSGYSGEGEASVYACGLSSHIKTNYGNKQEDVKKLIGDTDYTVSPDENLSNGDKVKTVAKYDKDQADRLKINVTNDSKTITVKGFSKAYVKYSQLPKKYTKKFDNWMPELVEQTFEDSLSDYDRDDYQYQSSDFVGKYYDFYSYEGMGELIYVYRVKATYKTKDFLSNATQEKDHTYWCVIKIGNITSNNISKITKDSNDITKNMEFYYHSDQDVIDHQISDDAEVIKENKTDTEYDNDYNFEG